MKTRKVIFIILIITLFVVPTAFADSIEPVSTPRLNEWRIIGKILEGLSEDIQEAREIQWHLTTEQLQEFLERYTNVTGLNAELAKVKEAKGWEAKLEQIIENLSREPEQYL